MDRPLFLDVGFHFGVPDPGARPAIAYAAKGRGLALFEILPAVATREAIDLPADDVATALAWVSAHRDELLAAWAEGLAPGRPAAARVAARDARVGPERRLALSLTTGAQIIVPLVLDPELGTAGEEAIAKVELVGAGEGLHWPALGCYRPVRDLVGAATGLQPLPRYVRVETAARQAAREAVRAPAAVPQVAEAALVDVTVPAGAAEAARAATATANGAAPDPAGPRAAEPARDGPPDQNGDGPRAMPPAGPGRIKSLLGLILYREGYLNQTQLQQVFQEQMRLKREGREVGFGQVAIDLGMITSQQMQFGVYLQNALSHAADGGKPLGVSLLESSVVIPSQLLAALEEHKKSGERLGEVLIRHGRISRETLDTFLERQREQHEQARPEAAPAPAQAPSQPAGSQARPPSRPAPAANGETSIKMTLVGTGMKSLLGIILERENYLTQSQVRSVIEEQDRRRTAGAKVGTFGEIALDMGLITQDQLKFAVQLQARLAYQPGKPKPLGFFLLENGVVKPSQLMKALEDAAKTERRLGEVLVEHGVVSEQMVDVFLKIQKAQSAK